jgi:hypothetical protein
MRQRGKAAIMFDRNTRRRQQARGVEERRIR